jgi:hypothetical protein
METMQSMERGVLEEARPEKESRRMVDLETLAKMSLESLLYYVLVGEGRTKAAAIEA